RCRSASRRRWLLHADEKSGEGERIPIASRCPTQAYRSPFWLPGRGRSRAGSATRPPQSLGTVYAAVPTHAKRNVNRWSAIVYFRDGANVAESRLFCDARFCNGRNGEPRSVASIDRGPPSTTCRGLTTNILRTLFMLPKTNVSAAAAPQPQRAGSAGDQTLVRRTGRRMCLERA